MLVKQKYSLELHHLLSSISKGYLRRQEILIFKQKHNNVAVLQKLLDDGFINSYKCVNNSTLVIFLKTNRFITNTSINLFNKNLTKRLDRKGTLRLNYLIKEHRKGNIPFYYLNTDKGFLSSYEAIVNNVGGKAIIKIN